MPAYTDTMTAYAGAMPLMRDYQASRLPRHYADFMKASAGAKLTVTAAAAAHDTMTAFAGAQLTQLSTSALHDTMTAKAGGVGLEVDSQALRDTMTAKGGAAPSMLDSAHFRDTLLTPAGAQPSFLQVQAANDLLHFQAGAQPAFLATAAQKETFLHQGGAQPSFLQTLHAVESGVFQAGAIPSQKESGAFRDTMTASAGGKLNVNDARVFSDVMNVGAGAGVVITATHHALDVHAFHAGAAGLMTDDFATAQRNFVAACRATAKAALPEIVSFPESLSEAQALTPVSLPFLLLTFGEDVDISDSYPVQTTAQRVQVEYVYVAHMIADSNTDEAQNLRVRLEAVSEAFMANRRLGGLVNRTEICHTPILRANQYQEHFAGLEIGPVSVMVLTLEYELVQSTLQWAK